MDERGLQVSDKLDAYKDRPIRCHVIEYSAYAKAIEALKFYAGYTDSLFEVVDEGRNYGISNVIYESDLSPEGRCDLPLGSIAREVLQELGE